MTRGSGAVGGGILVAASMVVMNIAGYALTVLAARVLGPEEYGAFAAMMGLVLVVNVVSLGLQATAARRVAVYPDDVTAIGRALAAAAGRIALTLVALSLLAAPVIAAVLRLDSWLTAAPLALAAAALTMLGGDLGVLQGSQRWTPYGLAVVAFGVSRIVVAGGAVLLWQQATAALWGVAVALLVPLAVTRWAVRRGYARHPEPDAAPGDAVGGLVREAAHGTHTLAAFFVLSTVDVLLARAVLPADEAGLYAAGLIVTKAVLFAPYFVSVVAFPLLARASSRRLHLWGLAVVLAIGLAIVVATAAFPRAALAAVGGQSYADVADRLWWFAVVGALLAGVQLLVTTALARRHTGAVWWLWGGVVGIVGGAWLADTVGALLGLVTVVDVIVLVALVVVTREDTVDVARADGVERL